jgi:predicted negative regulator of RcsB-dependent stress response
MERREEDRTKGQRIRYWGKKIIRIFFLVYILGLVALSGFTFHNKHKVIHEIEEMAP